jgi:hypothetical protein
MKLYCSALRFATLLVLTLSPAHSVFADQVQAGGIITGDDPGRSTNSVASSGTAAAGIAGNFGSSSFTASFGSLSANSSAIRTANGSKRGFTGGTAKWTDTFTIQPANPALAGTPGTAVITFHLSGTINGNLVGFQTGLADYRVVWDNTTQYEGYFQNNDPFAGTPIADLSTFSRTIPFTFGTPTAYEMSLSTAAQMGTGTDPGSASVHVTLTQGGITVLDNTSIPTAYRSTSSAGASRADQITNGTSFAGFTVTNSVGHQSALSLLGGTANSNTLVTATFIGNPDTNHLSSDVVDLSGTGTNLFVAQMQYDPLASMLDFIDESLSTLLWLDPNSGEWVNAVLGNSDGGASAQEVKGAFDALRDFELGKYGVDVTNHTVWAVLDHNSRFAAGVAFNPADVRWNSTVSQTNSVTLTLKGPPLGQYFIETNTDLATTNWGVMKLLMLDGNGTNSITDTNAISVAPQKFYRARQ